VPIKKQFLAKLGGVYGRLNLLTKPMQILNIDETGVSVVHKLGKVVAEVGQRVWSLTSAERGKTHTAVTCISATGLAGGINVINHWNHSM